MKGLDRSENFPSDGMAFEPVTGSDSQIEILYGLLSSRRNHISHKPGTVSYQAHREFVLNHPYRDWRIVVCDDNVEGAVYLSFQNTIGLNFTNPRVALIEKCLEFVTKSFDPLAGQSSVRAGKFHVNVSATDHELMTTLLSLGWVELQRTFVAG